MIHLARLLAAALLLGLAAAAIGFVGFVQLATGATPLPPHADGIVVLTGGAARIDRGLALLQQGQAPRLLVSGVAPGTEAAALLRQAGYPPAPLAPHITMGDTATSTHGNAREVRDWVQANRLRSLIVVTAFYHMPRALAELRRAVPGTTLYPAPVHPPATDPARRLLLAKEYLKYLAVRAGLPRADDPPAGGAGARG